MMEIHDRGTKKWVSLMLPEHVQLLEDIFAERKSKPLLDEQKQIEIDRKLKYGLTYQVNIKIIYYQSGNHMVSCGKIRSINQWKGYIVLSNGQGDFIPLSDVIDIII